MSNTKIELNSDGVREMLKSSEMQSICKEFADSIKDNFGDEAEIDVYVGINRCNASISAPYDKALDGNALLKALGGA